MTYAIPQIRFKSKPRRQLDVICEAIREAHGLVALAAKRLDTDAGNLRRYIRAHAMAQAAVLAARNAMGDFAESKLFQLIEKGDQRAIQFYLASVHRNRGYGLQPGEAMQVGDTNNQLVIQNVTIVPVPSGTFLPVNDPARPGVLTIEGELELEDTRTEADLSIRTTEEMPSACAH